ncbi:MAG: glycosyltransferase family 2 protein [bacterium]|nr:glycosyltransferase family 2 protein [bacterium]
MTSVFVVILNWNGKEDTIECLQSLKKLQVRNFNYQAVVVDNGSSDDSVKEITKRYRDVVVMENEENLGFTGGNNIGIRFALKRGADFVLILNNDTIVDRDLVVRLLEIAGKHQDTGIFSPKIYFAPGFEFHKGRYNPGVEGKVLWYAGGKMDWNNVLGENRGVDEVDRGQYEKAEEIDFATGACMFIRRDVLKKVGLFDERYFMYFEDADLSQRTREAGWKVMYTPGAYIWHKVARSSAIGSSLNDYFITRNRLLFGMKYTSLRTKFALLRETFRFLSLGRKWQRQGVLDFYLGRFGKGSFKN